MCTQSFNYYTVFCVRTRIFVVDFNSVLLAKLALASFYYKISKRKKMNGAKQKKET